MGRAFDLLGNSSEEEEKKNIPSSYGGNMSSGSAFKLLGIPSTPPTEATQIQNKQTTESTPTRTPTPSKTPQKQSSGIDIGGIIGNITKTITDNLQKIIPQLTNNQQEKSLDLSGAQSQIQKLPQTRPSLIHPISLEDENIKSTSASFISSIPENNQLGKRLDAVNESLGNVLGKIYIPLEYQLNPPKKLTATKIIGGGIEETLNATIPMQGMGVGIELGRDVAKEGVNILSSIKSGTLAVGLTTLIRKMKEEDISMEELLVNGGIGSVIGLFEPTIRLGTVDIDLIGAKKTLSDYGFNTSDFTNSEVLKSKFRRIVKDLHPDKGGNTEEYVRFTDAFNKMTSASIDPTWTSKETGMWVNDLWNKAIVGTKITADSIKTKIADLLLKKTTRESVEISPDNMIANVEGSNLKGTAAGNLILKKSEEAKNAGSNISIQVTNKSPEEKTPEGVGFNIGLVESIKEVPSQQAFSSTAQKAIEALGKETRIYRGAKDQTIDVTRPNGITGGVSFSTEKSVAERFAQKENGSVTEYSLSPEARVINHSELERLPREEVQKFLKENKVDVVRFDVPKGSNGEEELRVINSDVLINKNENNYQMAHRPSKTGGIGSDITQNGEVMPKDVYEHPEYYVDMSKKTYQQSFRAIIKMRGKPNLEVTVYRASPKNELNNGDWITLSKEYAKQEARDNTKVYSFKVKAKDIQFAGDDLNEFGYYPSEKIKKIKSPFNINADLGGYSDIESAKKTLEKIRAIQFPEIVKMTKEIMNDVPTIKLPRYIPRMGGRPQGLFYPTKNGKIVLNPEIFKTPDLAAKVLAHELGHLIDYLPDNITSRGNLVGRIASLNRYMKNAFGELENKTIKKELVELTKKWKPFDDKEDAFYTKYRYSSKELYADAISVLFNDPDLLSEVAPNFYKSFFEYIDKKPLVKKTFFAIQDILNGEDADILSQRRKTIRDSFTKGEDMARINRLEKLKKDEDFLFLLKNQFIDKNQRIIDKISELKKNNIYVNPEDNPRYFLEEHNYVGGVLKSFIESKIQPIYQHIIKSGLLWEDLGEYLFLNRVVNERGDLANPFGFDPRTAKQQLDFLKDQVGDEKFRILREGASKIKEAIDLTLDMAEKGGIYDPKIVKELKANKAYATFQVLDYLDKNIPASIKKQVGTLKDISNPANATVLKMLSVIKASERNMAKIKVVDFMKNNFSDEVQDAKTIFDGKTHIPIDPSEKDLALFTVMESGKLKGYYVDKYIAKTFDFSGTSSSNLLIKGLNFMHSNLYRPLYTTFSLGFQTFNLPRDFLRYYKNMPTLSPVEALKQYKKAFPHAWKRGFNIPDSIISKMENEKILSSTLASLEEGSADDDKQIEFILKKYDLLSKGEKNKIIKAIMVVPDFIENLGNTIEALPKVAAYLELQGKMSPKEMGHFIRTSAGSPDFLTRGDAYSFYNNVFLFSNAAIQGNRADAEIAFEPKTRGGWWFKTFLTSVLPKLLMYGALLGLYGTQSKQIMDSVSEHDKTNFNIIPLGILPNGKPIYMRIPLDESGRFIGGLVWKFINSQKNNQGFDKDLIDIISYMSGLTPSLSPAIVSSGALGQFVTGQNPYDYFRGRNILTEEQYKAGGKHALIPFASWLFQQSGGGIVMKATVGEQAPESKTWIEKTLEAPVLSNILDRWIKTSDYGITEKINETKRKLESQQAYKRIEEKQAILSAVKDFDPKKDNRIDYQNKLVKKIIGDLPYTPEQRIEASYIKKKFNLYYAKGGGDVYIDNFLSSTTNDEKEGVLDNMVKSLPKDKYISNIRLLKINGLISDQMMSKALQKIKK